mgnify:CR=1 FL=1
MLDHVNGAQSKNREQNEKLHAETFLDLFATMDKKHIPTREEMGDIWFLLDYRINYDRLLRLEEPTKLKNVRSMLADICDRITKDNPLGNLFLGIVEDKLGSRAEALRRVQLSRRYVMESAYWKKRFEALNLFALQDSLIKKLSPGSSHDLIELAA